MNAITPAFRVEQIGNATLYCGDCREVLPTLSGIDAVVTDPPYGVEFKGKVTKHTVNRPGSVYVDDDANFQAIVLPAVRMALSLFPRAAIFTGVRRMMEYPTPADVGGIVCPNGGGASAWGFGCYHPVLFYGKNPYLAAGLGSRPTATAIYHPGMHVTGEAKGNDHPCPKPIAFMEWAVERASMDNHTVLDPFMGSGTTGVACSKLGRNFIGIELDPHHFDTACRRIEAAQRQADLFLSQPKEDPSFMRTGSLFEDLEG